MNYNRAMFEFLLKTFTTDKIVERRRWRRKKLIFAVSDFPLILLQSHATFQRLFNCLQIYCHKIKVAHGRLLGGFLHDLCVNSFILKSFCLFSFQKPASLSRWSHSQTCNSKFGSFLQSHLEKEI